MALLTFIIVDDERPTTTYLFSVPTNNFGTLFGELLNARYNNGENPLEFVGSWQLASQEWREEVFLPSCGEYTFRDFFCRWY
jgi:hypothetical protein